MGLQQTLLLPLSNLSVSVVNCNHKLKWQSRLHVSKMQSAYLFVCQKYVLLLSHMTCWSVNNKVMCPLGSEFHFLCIFFHTTTPKLANLAWVSLNDQTPICSDHTGICSQWRIWWQFNSLCKCAKFHFVWSTLPAQERKEARAWESE